MKEIKAIIQPGKLETLREALADLPDFPGMSIHRAEGCGPTSDRTSQPKTVRQVLTDFSPKVRIEIIAPDAMVESILATIREATHTGRLGDGIAWVTPVESFLRIRD